jgi:hydrocephalus-inducing protein
MIRISWTTDITDLYISPGIAHIRAKGQKEFTVSFSAKQPMELSQIKAISKIMKIRYVNQSLDTEWDEKSKSIRWLLNESKSISPRKIVEQYPEPLFETLVSNIVDHILLINASADYSTYECETSHIKFKNTLMYQTRIFRFNLRNPGKVVLNYSFLLFNEENLQLTDAKESPFSINPSNGVILPGENSIITVRFSPNEDGQFSHTAVCVMPNLVKESKPLSINLQGHSLRPFCHFELEETDYIRSERRNLDASIPAILPSNTRVIEFSSCGVKVKNTKRFYITNPTNINYEFEWAPDKQFDQRFFRCLTTKGLVLSNKKFEMIFEFIPETIDLKVKLVFYLCYIY